MERLIKSILPDDRGELKYEFFSKKLKEIMKLTKFYKPRKPKDKN